MIFSLECVQEVVFLVVMFLLVVVGTLVITRLWPSGTEVVDGVDVNANLNRVGNNQKNGYVMQINKFDSSMNVNEWLKDFGLFLQVNEIDRNQHHILLSLLSPECLRIVRNMMAPSQVDFTCEEIIRILRNVWGNHPTSVSGLKKAFHTRVQKYEESTQLFLADLLELGGKAYSGVAVEVLNVYVKEQFIEGLCNQYVKLRVLENLPVLGDLTGVVRYVQQTESLLGTCGQLPMNVMDKWMPGVSSNNLSSPNSVVESQVPKQRTVQFADNSTSPVSVGSPMVASTPNINDRSQSVVRNCYSCGGVGHISKFCTMGSNAVNNNKPYNSAPQQNLPPSGNLSNWSMSNTSGSYFAPNCTSSFMATPIKGNLSGKRPNDSGMGSVLINDTIVGQSCHVESSSQCSSVPVASEIKGTCLINGLEVECLLDTGTSQIIISEEVWLRIKGTTS